MKLQTKLSLFFPFPAEEEKKDYMEVKRTVLLLLSIWVCLSLGINVGGASVMSI